MQESAICNGPATEKPQWATMETVAGFNLDPQFFDTDAEGFLLNPLGERMLQPEALRLAAGYKEDDEVAEAIAANLPADYDPKTQLYKNLVKKYGPLP